MEAAVSKANTSANKLGRYERQIMLSDWGTETQEKLRCSKVLVAGAGGLGCGAALNLALVGVGHISICDFDDVELSNLNRQFLHTEERIGTNKARSAQNALLSINPEVNVEPISHKIADDNVDDIVGDAQLILDCLDNFPARYALNLCAIRKGIPMVYGAIWGLEGHITLLCPPATPCLRCIIPEAPGDETVPVLGAVSCTVGSLQALEAIKFLTNTGGLLMGRMLILDFSTMQFQELETSKDPQCPVCGGNQT
jgi:molybdopterin/thiamine biosynthesis adenylyltransferase